MEKLFGIDISHWQGDMSIEQARNERGVKFAIIKAAGADDGKYKDMALLEVKTEWAVYKDCFLQVARYQADNSRAIEIWNNEDGPIARITVCITGSGLAEDETVIDTNNCPWAMEFIKQHGFGQATGRMVKSGYCTYPVVKLDIEKIGEYLEVA